MYFTEIPRIVKNIPFIKYLAGPFPLREPVCRASDEPSRLLNSFLGLINAAPGKNG